jgi:hypothetical protein
MPPLKDITGNKYGKLTVLSYAGGGKWECRCDCGKTVTARGDHLKSGNTVSCGCQNEKNIHAKKRNMKDITGEIHGDLEVLRYVRSDKTGTVWECKCHLCGKIVELRGDYVRQYTSCGCKAKSSGVANVRQHHAEVNEIKTNAGILLREEPNKNNNTGIRGVCYFKKTGQYCAYIRYHGYSYILKRSKDIDECIASRKEAEKALLGDFKKWYEQYKKEKNCEQ